MSAADTTNHSDKLDREVLRVAMVVVLGAIMSILDVTVVNVAIPTLAKEFKTTLPTIQWVATGYTLALATVIPLTGWAMERFGGRRMWMISVALFLLGSALCGLAWSTGSLIFFRVLQGFGGGMIMPVGTILLAQAAGPSRMGRIMSVIGVPMLLAPVFGPVIGGLIVDHISWRWIFYVNVPVGILGVALGLRLLPRGTTADHPGRLDWLGLGLISPGLALAVFGLSETSSHGGLGATIAWLPLVVGLVLTAAFVVHSLHAKRPLIDMRLFRNRAFSSAAGTTFLLGMSLFGAMILLPLYFQIARGESAVTAGLLQMPQGLGVALAMPFAGTLTDRIGGGRIALFGIALMTVATIPLALIEPHTSYFWLSAVLFVRGIALGASMMPSMAAAYAALERAEVPRATSALQVIQRVGGSIGTAVLAVVLSSQIASQVGVSGGVQAAGAAAARGEHVAGPLANAFGHTFWWALAMTAVSVLPALALVRATPRRRDGAPDEAPPVAVEA
jgi:EmrB/QacA subfamily drug resistance transporter